MADIDPTLNKLAGTCGTRFVRNRVGRLGTKHAIAWKNTLWLTIEISKLGGYTINTSRTGDGQFYVYLDNV